MKPPVHSSEFSDAVIEDFFDSVRELTWTAVEPAPDWVAREADAFVARKPRPTPDELRLHIDHAVAVARGWDHPHDRDLMLSAAVKSYYLIAWLEHLQERIADKNESTPLNLALKVSFTPVTEKQAGSMPQKGNIADEKQAR